MGKASDVSPRKLAKVAVLLQETNHSQRNIVKIVKVSQATVRRINSKLKMGVQLEAQRTGCCGRKRITSATDDRKIKKVIEQNRKMSEIKLKRVLKDQGINIRVFQKYIINRILMCAILHLA